MSLTFEAPAAQAIGRLVSVEAVEPAVTDSPVHGDEISDQVRLGFVNVTSEVVADADPYVAIDANRDTVDGVRVDTRVFLRAARRRFDYPDATVLSPVRRARSGEIAARLKLLER